MAGLFLGADAITGRVTTQRPHGEEVCFHIVNPLVGVYSSRLTRASVNDVQDLHRRALGLPLLPSRSGDKPARA